MPDRGGVLYYTINNRKAADSQPRSAQTNISCRKFYPLNRFILHENSPARRTNIGLSEYSATLT